MARQARSRAGCHRAVRTPAPKTGDSGRHRAPTAAALLASSSRAAPGSSGRTSTTRSAESRRTLLLVTSSVRRGAAASIGAAPRPPRRHARSCRARRAARCRRAPRRSTPPSSRTRPRGDRGPVRTRERPARVARAARGRRERTVRELVAEDTRELDRKARLADPARPDERHEPRPRIEQKLPERLELAVTADRPRRRGRGRAGRRPGRRRRRQKRIVAEDPALELAELRHPARARARCRGTRVPRGSRRARLPACPPGRAPS